MTLYNSRAKSIASENTPAAAPQSGAGKSIMMLNNASEEELGKKGPSSVVKEPIKDDPTQENDDMQITDHPNQKNDDQWK